MKKVHKAKKLKIGKHSSHRGHRGTRVVPAHLHGKSLRKKAARKRSGKA
jgi:hypothetical protein